jgi:hypothetical protein
MPAWDEHANEEKKNPTPFNTNAIPPAGYVSGNPDMLKSTGGAMQEGADVVVIKMIIDWINKKCDQQWDGFTWRHVQ